VGLYRHWLLRTARFVSVLALLNCTFRANPNSRVINGIFWCSAVSLPMGIQGYPCQALVEKKFCKPERLEGCRSFDTCRSLRARVLATCRQQRLHRCWRWWARNHGVSRPPENHLEPRTGNGESHNRLKRQSKWQRRVDLLGCGLTPNDCRCRNPKFGFAGLSWQHGWAPGYDGTSCIVPDA
jgi:hypothetical protein